MGQYINEDGNLIIDVFTISEDYKSLNKEDKMDALSLLKDWLDIEVIKIQFEE